MNWKGLLILALFFSRKQCFNKSSNVAAVTVMNVSVEMLSLVLNCLKLDISECVYLHNNSTSSLHRQTYTHTHTH